MVAPEVALSRIKPQREHMMCKCKPVVIVCLKHKLVPQGIQSVMR